MSDREQDRPKVGVAALIRRNGGKELLMGLRKGAHGAGTWSVPGGHMEGGECVTAGALRELREECGDKIANEALLVGDTCRLDDYTFTNMGPGRVYVTLYVAVDFHESWIEAELCEPDKFAELRWVKKGELPEPRFAPLLELERKLAERDSDLWTVGRTERKRAEELVRREVELWNARRVR